MADEAANDPQLFGLIRLGWDTAVFVVKPVATAIGTAAYYLAFGIVFVLRLLWQPLEFILLPFLYLGDFILQCSLAPFRFLAKFETLYVYLGIAAVVGIAGGLAVAVIGGVLQTVLGLDSTAEPQGRTVKDYRKARRKKDPMSSTASISPSSDLNEVASGGQQGRRNGKAGKPSKTPTILEELDSDY